MEEPTHIKSILGKPISIEDVITILKLVDVSDRPLMVMDGCWMRHFDIRTYRIDLSRMVVGCKSNRDYEFTIDITYSEEAKSDPHIYGEPCALIYILEKYSECSAVYYGWDFDLSAMMLGNTTVFKTISNKCCYISAEDIPAEEFEHAVEIPYEPYLSIKPHRVMSLIKSANKH
jgi:hypothetical protein